MAIFPPIKELPQKYHNITLVRSVELKTKLAERIGNILKLLDFFNTVQPDPKTKVLVDNFFAYLNRSLLDKDLINRRGAWLVRYADVVYDHLLIIKHGPVLNRETVVGLEENEFTTSISDLALAILDYHYHPNINQSLDLKSIQLIGQLLDLAKRVRPDLRYADYHIASEKIKSLYDSVTRCTNTGSILIDSQDTFLEQSLREILFYTDRFVSYQGVAFQSGT